MTTTFSSVGAAPVVFGAVSVIFFAMFVSSLNLLNGFEALVAELSDRSEGLGFGPDLFDVELDPTAAGAVVSITVAGFDRMSSTLPKKNA